VELQGWRQLTWLVFQACHLTTSVDSLHWRTTCNKPHKSKLTYSNPVVTVSDPLSLFYIITATPSVGFGGND
jgi:hypothetical protein